MSVVPSDVAMRQPAEIVIVDSRTGADVDTPPLSVEFDKQQVERFFRQERARRVGQPTGKPLSRAAELVLRVGAALILLMAAAQAWFAATGIHP